jgi:ABC-2 type transport system permease protein
MSRLLADARTIVWKEWAEFVRQRGTIISMLFFIGIFGLFLPFQRGRPWAHSQGVILNAVFLPIMLVLGVVADSFAGERERHTLETLLASRLTDRAILVGKFLAVVGYGAGLTLTGLLVALVTINLKEPSLHPAIYTPRIALGCLAFSLLSGGFAAAVGVLVSLRAATVRQAAQTLSIGMMVLFFLGITAFTTIPSSWKDAIADTLKAAGPEATMLIGALILLALDAALLSVAAMRFERTRLILD